jgi:hypothetical protein
MPEWARYYRKVEGWSDDVNERLEDSGLDWYRDRGLSLVARCDPARLSEVLSGEPLAPEEPLPQNPEPQWLSLADLNTAVVGFTAPSSEATKMLRAAGLLARREGKDVPTPAARGLYLERPMKMKYGRPREGAVQRLWAFEVVRLLRALPDEDKPKNKLENPDTWKTGGEPMTDKQSDCLKKLCFDRDEPFDPSLSKAAASARINELTAKPKVPMTAEQATQLKKLSEEAGVAFYAGLSRAAAAVKIEKLTKRVNAGSFDSGVSGKAKRARLSRDVLSALDSTHPKGTEVVLVQEVGATGFWLIEVALRNDGHVILEVEAAALELL